MNAALNAEQVHRDLARLVGCYSESQSESEERIQQLLLSDRRAFCAAGIDVLAEAAPSAGTRYLAQQLANERLLGPGLLDTVNCRTEHAIAAVRAALEANIAIQGHLEFALKFALQEPSCFANTAKLLRILDLLVVAATPGWRDSSQVELMNHPDSKVRSRAALLIGRSNKNANWLSRRFRDRDPRVLANAVEAMWAMPVEEVRSLLAAAAQSPNNRVQANALLGLYRAGDPTAVPGLLKMARHVEPLFRMSAFWAMGQTGDSRFVAVLNREFKASEGKVRLSVTRALAQIRRREKAAADAGPLELRLTGQSLLDKNQRQICFTVRSKSPQGFGTLSATDVTVFDNGRLVENCEFQAAAKPATLLLGIVLPHFVEKGPERDALTNGLKLCLGHKRPQDMWRIDQYSTEKTETATARPDGGTNLPYDDALITSDLKAKHGFFPEPELIGKALDAIVPRDRAWAHMGEALGRQSDAIAKLSGKRDIILLLRRGSLAEMTDQLESGALKKQLQAAGATLHCVATEDHPDWNPLRSFCESSGSHTFTATSREGLGDALETLSLSFLNHFELRYEGPAYGPAVVKVTSDQGSGNMQVPLPVLSEPAADLQPPRKDEEGR